MFESPYTMTAKEFHGLYGDKKLCIPCMFGFDEHEAPDYTPKRPDYTPAFPARYNEDDWICSGWTRGEYLQAIA